MPITLELGARDINYLWAFNMHIQWSLTWLLVCSVSEETQAKLCSQRQENPIKQFDENIDYLLETKSLTFEIALFQSLEAYFRTRVYEKRASCTSG